VNFPTLIGPSYTAAAYRADTEETRNWIPQTVESPGAVAQRFLHPTPGYVTWATVSDSPIRALFAQDGRCFAVVGAVFYEATLITPSDVTAGATLTNRGAVTNDLLPAVICSGGDAANQLGIISGGTFYSYDLLTNVLTPVPAAGTGLVTGGYLDGYFWTLDDASTFHLSDLLDGLTWDPLQVAQRNDAPDRWISGLTVGKRIWLFGSETSSVLYDAATFPFPFALVPDALIPQGIAAVWSAVNVNGIPVWLSEHAHGARTIVAANGFGPPTKVSQAAVEYALDQYTTIRDGVGMAYQWQGRWIYQLSFPQEDQSWAVTMDTGEWFQPSYWNVLTSEWECARAQTHCFAFGQPIVGDRATGTLYRWDGATCTDASGAACRRVRRVPLPRLLEGTQWIKLHDLELLLDVGIGTVSGQGVDPQLILRISRDGGKTWGNDKQTTAGAMGAYWTRVMWQRLGRVRDGLGVVEIVVTDPNPWRLVGAAFTVAA